MEAKSKYVPGVCNIGEEERFRRAQMGWTGLYLTVIFLSLLAYLRAPAIFRLVVFLPAAFSAIGFLQARMHFCAYFGSVGVFNFGKVGKRDTVQQAEFRKKDREKALQIILYSAIVGAVVAVGAYYYG